MVGPLGVAAVGAAVVWREADETQRKRWAGGARVGRRSTVLRLLTGVVFVSAGIAVYLLGNIQLGQAQFALLAVLATLVGVAVLTVPFWLRMVRDLGEERRARIRTEERAEIAAHLHDSVLQTLALIQKRASSKDFFCCRGHRRGSFDKHETASSMIATISRLSESGMSLLLIVL